MAWPGGKAILTGDRSDPWYRNTGSPTVVQVVCKMSDVRIVHLPCNYLVLAPVPIFDHLLLPKETEFTGPRDSVGRTRQPLRWQ